MKTDQAQKMIDQSVRCLAADLAAGHSDSFRRYLAVLARFTRYSLGNVLLIWAQRPDATRVAGFHTWLKLGRHVRKGEKGIAILAPVVLRADPEQDARPDGPDRTPRAGRFKVVHVFDLAQTDGEPLPEREAVRGDPGAATARLLAFARSRGIAVERGELPPGVDGTSSGGRVTLRDGLAPAEEFSVLAHELAHELLHQHPAGADQGEARPPREQRELEAEAVAYVAGAAAGLDMGATSRDYILTYGGDPAALERSLQRITATAAVLVRAACGADEPAGAGRD